MPMEKKVQDAFRVSSWNSEKSFKDACEIRGETDDWAMEVKGKIACVGDLPAADAIYHRQCNLNFRNGKSLPRKFNTSEVQKETGVGRPRDELRYKAFQFVMNDFYENDDETVTITELRERMRALCEPYSESEMRRKLKEIDDIIISDFEKQTNIVTTKICTYKVLKNFRAKQKLLSGEKEWKKEIIHTAASLIKAEIDEVKEEREYYPDIACISDIEQQLDYVPFYLRNFLKTIFKSRKTDMDTRVAAIGQAIMQQQRPRSLMTPLQFATTMRVHNDCPGLVSDLNKFGFCLSLHEAYLFKACAASDCPDPFSLMEGKFGWIIGDNFDHNKKTLTGHDTLHVMGLMLTQTPASAPPHRIPRSSMDNLK